MGLERTVAPSDTPLTLAEAKQHLRLTPDHDSEDALILTLLGAAVGHVEHATRRSLMTQAWRLTRDAFPCRGEPIELPMGPVTAVTTVSYRDADGVTQTLDAATYRADLDGLVGRVAMREGRAWPATDGDLAAVAVTYATGFADAGEVPAELRALVLLVLGDLYENREAVVTGTIMTKNPTVERLLWLHKAPEV